MNGLPYYKAYPRDFFEGTVGMDFEAKAAYRLVLDLIYMHGGRLVDDARFIAGHLGCSVKKWNALRQAILATGKLVVTDGYLGNYRADKELDSLKSFQTKQRENGSQPKKNKNLAEATAEPKPNHTEPEPDKEPDTNVSGGKPLSIFDIGLAALMRRGLTDRQARSVTGKWRSEHGEDATLSVLRQIEKHDPSDPVGYGNGILRKRHENVEGGAFGRIPERN
jgi:uncharacterized protein YdaU (DUF1376 family)